MKKYLLSLLLPIICYGQAFTQNDLPWLASPATASRWYPTNAAFQPEWWGELTPLNGTFGEVAEGNPHPVADNHRVLIWTNWAYSSDKWTADQTLHPTNFISGGGGNSTSPRLLFTAATSTRIVGGAHTSRNLLTFIFVCNCTDTVAPTSTLLKNGSGDPTVQFTGGTALQISAGTTLTGPSTLILGTWYVVTAVFNGASSQIYTNGVLYKSGNAGTSTLGSAYLAQFDTPGYRGNISRFWGWTNILSAGDLTSAVNQCKTDFGIP